MKWEPTTDVSNAHKIMINDFAISFDQNIYCLVLWIKSFSDFFINLFKITEVKTCDEKFILK